MDHVAIMNRKYKLIEAIISGKKTIESRWYKTKRAPWGRIHPGESVYFKESGGLVLAKAQVNTVLEYDNLTLEKAKSIVEKFGKHILIQEQDVQNWAVGKQYCILIFLSSPESIIPFDIDKTGFGNAAAWLAIPDIENIRVKKRSS